MDYTNGDGEEHTPIEVLTREAFSMLTGHEEIPDDVPLELHIKCIGETFRVEDVVKHWPGAAISQEEFNQRLVKLRHTRNSMGVPNRARPNGLMYRILHPRPIRK